MDLPAQILGRAKAGDPAAQAEVLRRALGPVRALIHRLGFPTDKEDQLQDALHHLLRALPGFDPAGSAAFGTWAFTVVYRWLLMQRRRRHLDLVPLEQAREVADRGEGADVLLERRELGRLLERAVAELPLAQRRVFVMAQVHGVPLQDVAEAEGLPLGTVKSRLHRARAELALRLGPALDEQANHPTHELGGAHGLRG
jgi:RNA polymerase sigma-70 factor (ECF subfamily)